MTVRELCNGELRLRFVPEVGASLVDCSARLSGAGWVPILRPVPDPLARSSDASSFLLAPYSNRLRDGRFRFEGRLHTLRHPEKHAIHGDVRDRPWQLVEMRPERARLRLESHCFEDLNFPFPFAVEVCYELEGRSLVNHLRLQNTGGERMPAGLGFHPYFRRTLLDAAETVELELRVRGVYPGETPLPTGPMVPVRPAQDFHVRRPLDGELDHCFGGWDGRAALRWPGSGVDLRLEAIGECMAHVIVYSPAGQPFFAIEPVSHANDGFNLHAAGHADVGVVILAPGETLEGGFRLTL